jgi:hypothetical protein
MALVVSVSSLGARSLRSALVKASVQSFAERTYRGFLDDSGGHLLVTSRLQWLSRNSLNALLTRELQEVSGCEGASINVGPSRDAEPGESNWWNFSCTVPEGADAELVLAVAGGVVSEARERYNVLDS